MVYFVREIEILMPDKNAQRETQARTKETRKLLLGAAEKIFVRDGYEKAQVAQIAASAGRTKGAGSAGAAGIGTSSPRAARALS